MKTLWYIAQDSIRNLLNQKLLVGLMLATLAMTIVFSILMSHVRSNITSQYSDESDDSAATTNKSATAVTNGMTEKQQHDFRESMENASSTFQAFFYQVASFGGSIVSLFIFSTAVASEIRKGTVRLTLSKPVSRTQFLLGKYLGGILVMAGYALISALALVVFTQSQSMEMGTTIRWAPWLMFCRQLMLGSLAMLLSLLMPPIVAAVLAFFAGNGFYASPNPLYFVLPSYSDFNVFTHILHGTLIHFSEVAWLTLYAADFVAIMLLFALWRFRTKELIG